MMDGFGPLALTTAGFLALHWIVTRRAIRGPVVRAVGEGPYLAAFSVAALALITGMAMAYGEAPFLPVLWFTGDVGAIVSVLVMPVAYVLLVASVSAPNPTMAGAPTGDDTMPPPTGALRITRHPMMWAFGLWGLCHLFANGELRSIILFGALTALALIGTVSIDAKVRRREAARFERLRAQTSILPFAAILGGRQSLGAAVREIGWRRLAIALILYAATLYLHPWLFGVYAMPTTL